MTPLRMLAAAAAAIVLAACATTPPQNNALEQARAAYGAAQADPHVQEFARTDLELAERALNEAEQLWRNDAPSEFVSHRAYVAEQRARIAQETAMARAADAEVAQVEQARRRMALEARAREAEREARRAEREAREAQIARERAEAQARATQARIQAMEQAREAAQAKRLAAAEELGAQVRGLEGRLPELQARQTERGWTVSLSNEVLFQSGEAALKPSGRRALDDLARVLRQHPERNLLVEGYTDEAGGEVLNRHLSERRAHALRNALVLAGVDSERIVASGKGSATADPSLNRRMLIVIAPGSEGAAAGATR